MALISVHQVKLSLGGVSIFSGVDLQLERGERVGLLGRNGAGKSTLMRLIAGEIKPDAGELKLHGSPVIGRLIQEVPAGSTLSAFSMVSAGLGSRGEALGEAFDLGLRLAQEPEISDRFEAAQARVTELGAWGEQAPVEKILSKLGLEAETPFDTLSAGLKRRVLLAQALVREPDVLLLDEPTNHMDLEAIEKLESTLLRGSQTLLFTTHDREFLERVSTRIVELDRGALRSFPGNYSRFLEQRQAFLEAEEKQWAAFDKKLAQEEAWIRRGVKARNVRNMGRVRVLQEMRAERAERRERIGKVGMQLQDAERSGALVAKVDKLRFERNGQVLVDQFSTLIMRGDRLGIIGPNGVGKTTLIKLLLGELEPTAGEVKLGTNLQVAVFDQLRDQLDESKSVCDNIDSDGDFVTINGSRRHVMGYLEDFLFSRERARGPIQKLSGGERNRLLLARRFTKPANVLILDEPTNDLDLETLEVLEDLLAEFQGTILIVSHDRAFLNNVVTSTLYLEGGGRINEYVGGYDDALRQGMAARQAEREKEREKDKSRAKAEEKPVTKASKKGLSYKEKRELEELPDRIEALEARQAELTAQMGEADFYKRPQSEIAAASAALEAMGPQIEAAMARWEELESRAD